MIVFRVDANQNIGMGHIMRCLSIAGALSADGSILFVLADNNAVPFVEKVGFKYHVLGSDYRDMERELESWPNLTPDVILVDSYYVTNRYLADLKKKTGKLVYMDDRALSPYPVDLLINYNAHALETNYAELYSDSDTPLPEIVLGPSYAPLRSMFKGLEKNDLHRDAKNILISTGGADDLSLELRLVEYLTSHGNSGYIFHVLIGVMNVDKNRIRKLAKGRDEIILYENVSDMRSLICSCDIAVSAAGSTLYEICACGVPMITYSSSDDQSPCSDAFGNLRLAINMGEIRGSEERFPEMVMGAVSKLAEDYEERCIMSEKMQNMVDGFGAEKIAKMIG